jgi:hypothetical protein
MHRPKEALFKGCIVQGMHQPKDALSKGQNIQDFSFGDMSVREEITLHCPAQFFLLQCRLLRDKGPSHSSQAERK